MISEISLNSFLKRYTMNIYYDSGRCGDGKTFYMLNGMVNSPTKYILSIDKIDLMGQRMSEIYSIAGADTEIQVSSIHSHNVDGPVAQAVEAIAENPSAHQIVLITHAALKLAKFDHRFSDWSLVIDEDFSTLTSDSWSLSASREMMSEAFKTKPVGSFLKLEPSNLTVNDLKLDDAIDQKVAELRRLMDFQDVMTDKPVIGDVLTWWSVWDYRRLAAFARVTILANAFTEKLSYHLASLNGVTFVPVVRASSRQWQSRPVTISYFSNASGSMNFLKSQAGQANLAKIQNWQVKNHKAGREYWSANERLGLNLAGTHISPLAAGRNDLMSMDVATFIFSAQASPSEHKALDLLSGGQFDADLIKRDRELEAISQFILRGSLRDPSGSGAYSIRLYSKEQAEFASAFLIRNGYVETGDVTVEFIDIGLTEPTPKKRGRKPVARTAAEIEARVEATREVTRKRVAACRARKKAEALAAHS